MQKSPDLDFFVLTNRTTETQQKRVWRIVSYNYALNESYQKERIVHRV